MGDTLVVGRNFDLGFQSDIARDQLPKGAAFRQRDYIPQLGAASRKRGGWSHGSRDLNASSSASSMRAAAWAPFPGDPHLISVSEGGKVYQIHVFDGTAGDYVGATTFSGATHQPFWHKSMMIVLQALDIAAASPRKYYDTGGAAYAVATLGGTPPQARVGASWGEYMILANGYVGGTLYSNRAWWSDPGLPEIWNPGSSFWDMPQEIVRVVPMRNIIVFFGYENSWSLVGDTPPPGGNFTRRDLFKNNGTMDGRSVKEYRDYVIWANMSGIWKSDGAVLTDLTFRAGISNWYRELVSSFNFKNGWSAVGGVYRGFYFLTIHNNAGAYVATVLLDLERDVAFEFQNIPAAMFAERSSGPGTTTAGGNEELFFAHRNSPRVEYLSACWTPASANAADADGNDVLPEIETPFYKMEVSHSKRVRRVYFTYDLRTAGEATELDVGFITSPEETSYTAATPVLPATTTQRRLPVFIRRKTLGVGFKITQVGQSADTRLAEIELEGHPTSPER